ncbi:DMT family transporter [Paenibacillus harenae]|uniref:DMT family transporter n=1 Tax=Paenibacillus harenae TaxID=306543 RepID=UPI0027950E9A|nr:multidrug efflux SMR transporter [Paenibacillus harenae]MDQ0059863.1 multidrug resistance protein EbrB [Paenibacillus harenae]
MKGYFYLSIAVISEIFGTSMLKLSDSFTSLLPSIGVIIGFGISFYCLSIGLRTVPLSLAYAIWSGLGTAITALIGVLVWGDSFTIDSFGAIILIIGGVVLLNASSGHGENAAEPSR